jgi:DNA helicase-2/ATP-dependent DNA helicase PcrA
VVLSLEEILEGLDPDQRTAVTSIRGPVCVIAGAGTGKTRVITHRIAYAVAAGVTDPSKTLALTFTARAAGEMRTRLRGLGIPNATARTFHSAALKQLLYFWPNSFGGAFPSLLTTKSGFLSEAINRAQTSLAPQSTILRDIAGEIEWAKVLEIGPEDYVERAQGEGRSIRAGNNRGVTANLEEVAKIYSAYESLKRSERAVDFEDVLLLTVGMLEEDRDVRERIRDQYRYFTVDEYQDVSPLQQRLLNLWLGNREEICVVGDAAQTIYSFAGASSAFLLNFTKKYPSAEIIRLNRGYRSTPEIIGTANAILRQGGMLGEPGSELTSMNERGIAPAIHRADSPVAETKDIVQKIIELKATHEAEHGSEAWQPSIAILARTNSQLDSFEKALAGAGVDSLVKSNDRFFERVDVKDALRAIRSGSVLPVEDGNWFGELESILRPFGSADYVQAFLRMGKKMFDEGAPDLRAYLRELEDRAEQNNPPTLPGVVLATLHSAKGLEWDHVFLVGVSEGFMPFGGESANNVNEERRLFYVGLTRAKKQVHISYSGSPSPFLSGLLASR